MTNSPSPLVLINSTPQVNGVNVTAGSTVTVSLASNAGVYAWNLICVGVDELSSVDTVNGTIVINHSNNTATFTMPNHAGAAVILKSIVNNGADINGVVLPQYSTTAGVYVLADSNKRVGAQNETTEGDSTNGWLSKINPLIRTSSLSAPVVASYTAVPNANHNAVSTEYIIGCDKSNQAVTVTLPASPTTGQCFVIVDTAGVGATYNRTVNGNGYNINGSSTFVLSNNYGAVGVFYSGSQWYVMFNR